LPSTTQIKSEDKAKEEEEKKEKKIEILEFEIEREKLLKLKIIENKVRQKGDEDEGSFDILSFFLTSLITLITRNN
jgi:hypothetical protein